MDTRVKQLENTRSFKMFFNFKSSHSQLLYLYSCHTHYCESEDGLTEDRRRSQLRTLTEEEKGVGDPRNGKDGVQLLASLFAHTHQLTACPRVSAPPSGSPALFCASARKEERREGASTCISRLLACHCALPSSLLETPPPLPPRPPRPFPEDLPSGPLLPPGVQVSASPSDNCLVTSSKPQPLLSSHGRSHPCSRKGSKCLWSQEERQGNRQARCSVLCSDKLDLAPASQLLNMGRPQVSAVSSLTPEPANTARASAPAHTRTCSGFAEPVCPGACSPSRKLPLLLSSLPFLSSQMWAASVHQDPGNLPSHPDNIPSDRRWI
ncbi:uncharacterized protein LOC118903742 [Balaenoptera musculus]|uniref:Uncharacterized protein LOC118903742 n=1 Tax=Balaenoptera musculus TaxID=9771 RepID=A0A8B8YVK0_BALMU|nr:uncharacterized protein LOC118903742 [Balaenoptera musculus]XP_036725056.1 uncharacterized protein LOC118903742 [Balaenoptera musculus]